MLELHLLLSFHVYANTDKKLGIWGTCSDTNVDMTQLRTFGCHYVDCIDQ